MIPGFRSVRPADATFARRDRPVVTVADKQTVQPNFWNDGYTVSGPNGKSTLQNNPITGDIDIHNGDHHSKLSTNFFTGAQTVTGAGGKVEARVTPGFFSTTVESGGKKTTIQESWTGVTVTGPNGEKTSLTRTLFGSVQVNGPALDSTTMAAALKKLQEAESE